MSSNSLNSARQSSGISVGSSPSSTPTTFAVRRSHTSSKEMEKGCFKDFWSMTSEQLCTWVFQELEDRFTAAITTTASQICDNIRTHFIDGSMFPRLGHGDWQTLVPFIGPRLHLRELIEAIAIATTHASPTAPQTRLGSGGKGPVHSRTTAADSQYSSERQLSQDLSSPEKKLRFKIPQCGEYLCKRDRNRVELMQAMEREALAAQANSEAQPDERRSNRDRLAQKKQSLGIPNLQSRPPPEEMERIEALRRARTSKQHSPPRAASTQALMPVEDQRLTRMTPRKCASDVGPGNPWSAADPAMSPPPIDRRKEAIPASRSSDWESSESETVVLRTVSRNPSCDPGPVLNGSEQRDGRLPTPLRRTPRLVPDDDPLEGAVVSPLKLDDTADSAQVLGGSFVVDRLPGRRPSPTPQSPPCIVGHLHLARRREADSPVSSDPPSHPQPLSSRSQYSPGSVSKDISQDPEAPLSPVEAATWGHSARAPRIQAIIASKELHLDGGASHGKALGPGAESNPEGTRPPGSATLSPGLAPKAGKPILLQPIDSPDRRP